MADTGVKYPATKTAQSVSPESANTWVSITNIGADDGVYASIVASTYDGADISYRAKAQGFGFAIPAGATIDGILVEIERYGVIAGDGKDYRVQLLDAAGALVGDNKADIVNVWPQTATIKSYGGAADKWNATPTVAMVNDVDFGVVLSVTANNQNADIYVDFIRITVYYTAETPKTSSDTGVGADARVTGSPVATHVRTEAGSGVDVVAQAEAILQSAETGAGADARGSGSPVATLVRTEVGSGVDVVVALSQLTALITGDSGVGVDAVLEHLAILARSDNGLGVDQVLSRLFALLEVGFGVDVAQLTTGAKKAGKQNPESRSMKRFGRMKFYPSMKMK